MRPVPRSPRRRRKGYSKETTYQVSYLGQVIELSIQFLMQILKLNKLLLEMPLRPPRSHIDLVNEGVVLEMADLDLGHGDLREVLGTLIVEKVCSIISEL